MNLRDLLKKHEDDGITFHSEKSDIDIRVFPGQDEVVVQESSTHLTHFKSQYRGERQIEYLLEDYGMKTDNFPPERPPRW